MKKPTNQESKIEIEELRKLYLNTSKHSNYQVLPSALKKVLQEDLLEIKSRHEDARLEYMKRWLDFRGKTILDIGGNTGFFSFEMVEQGASRVCHFEGNNDHSKFVELGSKVLGLDSKIETISQYFNFKDETSKYDIALLFNVLHHIGDDYADASDVNVAKARIIEQVNFMSGVASELVLQLGFNWMGNPELPLFANGTKSEMIDFVRNGVKDQWDIMAIGVAEKRQDGTVTYDELNDQNIERDDSIGEFLNRPMFILKSKNM